MTDTQHTPGPWKYGPDNRKTMRVFSGSREIVRALSTHGNRRLNCVERAANARLIAAAPELLEALQGLLRSYRDFLPERYLQDKGVATKAMAAIAKATAE